jgi:hypothetical protein
LKRLYAAPGKLDDASQDLDAVAAFDYDVLQEHHEGVHQWLFRRWNGFNIAANSISALVLSLPAAPFIKVPWNIPWCASVTIFVVILVFAARCAWRDTMHMLRFMANLEANKSEQDAWPDKAQKRAAGQQ